MSKKRRWFNKGWGGSETEIDTNLFSNTIAKHQKKLDDVGMEVLPEDIHEDDYGYSSYNWDLDRKLGSGEQATTGDRKIDKKNSYSLAKTEYEDNYSSYQKTGVWRGYSYYQQPKLTYKYVQQMANVLSAKHNVKVQVGNDWNVDLLKKTLTYNPASLIYGTKSELLATLMHEIGKLRYVTHSSLLKNKFLTMYKMPALEVLSIYEDLRTDFLMLKAYEGASEIYESVIPTIELQVEQYMKKGKAFRELVAQIPERVLSQTMDKYRNMMNKGPLDPVNDKDPELQKMLLQAFGTSDLNKVEEGIKEIHKASKTIGSIYEYCGEMLSLMYDLDDQGNYKFANITEKVELTVDTIEKSKKSIDSQALVDFMDVEVYPKIEDLLKDAKNKHEAIEKAFPNMSQGMQQAISNAIQDELQRMGQVVDNQIGMDARGNMKVRQSKSAQGLNRNNSTVPPEWEAGDYKVLKESVDMEIKQLVNRLTFIRREELTVRYQADQKRGRLNAKKLYKASTKSRRLFKTKLENTATIQSFAFSVLLDVSGSMSGARITHATRGLIILSEVFKKMNIPFELVVFSNGAKTIKPFSSEMTKTLEKEIGGLVRMSGGGTNLDQGLAQLKIHGQPEKNKIVVVLSDGDVGNAQEFDNNFFMPWKKKGIKSTAFGIECGDDVKKLCMGNSRAIQNASQLPVEFSNLLKNLIKR